MAQQIVAKIVDMLSDERSERRCAAAMVLGGLRVKDDDAKERLCACLTEGEGPLQLYALEALVAMRAKKIAPFVTPLLDSKDEEIRALATGLLASQGARSAAALARELDSAPLPRQRAIVAIIGRNHNQEIFERLLGYLERPDLGEAVVNTLRGEIDQMDDKALAILREALAHRLKDKQWTSEPLRAARAVRLLGYYRDARLVQVLLPFATDRHPTAVRLAALAGLRRPLQAARSTATALKAMLEHAGDDEACLARAAVDTLRSLKLDGFKAGTPPAGALSKLAAAPLAEARRFAVETLGKRGDVKSIKVLIEHLLGDDPATRDASGRALVRAEGAGKGLVKELQRLTNDPEALARLCRVLRPHAADLDTAARLAVAELAIAALEARQEAAEHLLGLLRLADPPSYAALLLERALKHRRAKRFDQAFALLERLDLAGLLEEDGHYTALVCGLCNTTAKKDLGRASRTTDPVLRHAVTLVGEGFPLAGKLKRERALGAEDLFFVGFNFAESRDEDEKEFGGALLAHLVAKSPRSKLGKSAKNKMRLVGID